MKPGKDKDPWVVETCKVLSELFNLPVRPGKFPGCLPVDVVHSDLISLSYGYVMSYKADGGRAFLFLQGQHSWLYHRNGSVEWIHCSKTLENGPITMFDVEVMVSTKSIYLFDALMYTSRNLLRTDYLQRMELARKWCAEHPNAVRNELQTEHTVPSRHADTTVELGKYNIQSKPVFPTYKLNLLKKDDTSFDEDGYIFTQLRSAYLPYRTSMIQVFKWKPPSQLTIDVHFTYWDNRKLDYHTDIPSMFNNVASSRPHYLMSVVNEGSKSLVPLGPYMFNLPKPLSAACSIYEVGWREGAWQILKHRKDKVLPNALSTAVAALRLIQEPVQESDLVYFLTPRVKNVSW
jgi:hypothetical protein